MPTGFLSDAERARLDSFPAQVVPADIEIRCYHGFRTATPGDTAQVEDWLVERALEHDRPTLLLRLARERLLGLRVGRPGVTHLEKLIAAARQQA